MNKRFKTMRAVVSAALILSASVIITSSILPGVMVKRLYESAADDLDAAMELALAGENPLAYERIESLCEKLDKKKHILMAFYDHNGVIELTGSAEAARELAKTKDTAQLVVELYDIRKAFDYLIHSNDARFYNVF